MTDKPGNQSKKSSVDAISRWENEGGATQKQPRKLPDEAHDEASREALKKMGKYAA
jgi:hypothetical protein